MLHTLRSSLAPALLVPAMMVLLSACQPAAPPQLTDADREAIRGVLASFADAMKKNDFAAAAALYTEDAVLLPPSDSAVTGHAAIEAFMRTFPPITEFTAQDIDMMGDTGMAVVRGRYTLTVEVPNVGPYSEAGKFMDVRVKQPDGRWLMKWDMFSSDTAPPPPPPPASEKKAPAKK